MRTVMMPVKMFRPADATPERALELKRAGVSVKEMAKMWGISRSRIYQLIHKVDGKKSATDPSSSSPTN